MKIVVFGNSLLTMPTFQALVQNHMVAGLCTDDSSSEETQRIQWIARQANVPLLSVNKRNLTQKLEKWLRNLQPDIALVLTFSYKIPIRILNIPPLGFYNFHFAKLPEYRGPQPIFWELVNREADGAITVHQMDARLDHGPIAIVEKIPILPSDTHGIHMVNLSFHALGVVQKLIVQLQNNPAGLVLIDQNHTRSKYYHRPKLEDVTINWETQDSHQINALVKACNPWNNGAYASIRGINLRLVEVTLPDETVEAGESPGTIVEADRNKGIWVACKDQRAVKIDIVYMEEGFLLGTRLLDLGINRGEQFTLPQQMSFQ